MLYSSDIKRTINNEETCQTIDKSEGEEKHCEWSYFKGKSKENAQQFVHLHPLTKNFHRGKKTFFLVRTPFDQVLEKLSNCAATSTLSPSVAEVMEENLLELQRDEKYISLFQAAPHMAAFLKKKKKDPTKFIPGLRQSLHADWSNPAWKSYKEIDTLFRPLKQQFVYTMMRFNCT